MPAGMRDLQSVAMRLPVRIDPTGEGHLVLEAMDASDPATPQAGTGIVDHVSLMIESTPATREDLRQAFVAFASNVTSASGTQVAAWSQELLRQGASIGPDGRGFVGGIDLTGPWRLEALYTQVPPDGNVSWPPRGTLESLRAPQSEHHGPWTFGFTYRCLEAGRSGMGDAHLFVVFPWDAVYYQHLGRRHPDAATLQRSLGTEAERLGLARPALGNVTFHPTDGD